MILNMGPILRGEINRMEIHYDLSPEPIADVSFPENAHVSGVLTDEGGYMRLHLTASLAYTGQCARCLTPVQGVFTLDFDRTVAAEGSISEEQLAEMDDAYVMIRDGRLDVDEPLREELLMCFPMRLLCEEKGIAFILIKAPTNNYRYYWYDEWDAQVREYAEGHQLAYYNFIPLCDEIGIDWSTDTYDGGAHLNVFGAEKLTSYFGAILAKNLGLEGHKEDAALSRLWQEKVDAYYRERNGTES